MFRAWGLLLILTLLGSPSLCWGAQGPVQDLQAAKTSLQKGILLYQEKMFEAAHQEFQRAAKTDHNSAEAFFYLGMVEAKLGQVA